MGILTTELTKADFDSSGWSVIIDNCEKKECQNFSYAFRDQATLFEEKEKNNEAKALNLLKALCFMTLRWNDPTGPFVAQFQFDTMRSACPDDFEELDINALKLICDESGDHEFISRISDFLWIKTKDHIKAMKAVDAYLESSKRLESPTSWSACYNRIGRALQLSAQLGRSGELFKKVIKHIQSVIDKYNGNDPLFLTAKLMELLHDQKEGDSCHYAAIAEKAAQSHEGNSKWEVARAYWEVAIRFHSRALNVNDEKRCLTCVAESYVKEAEEYIESHQKYMVPSDRIVKAIETYRKVDASSDRIEELHILLLGYQSQIENEMHYFSTEFNVNEQAENSRSRIKGLDFNNAVIQLTLYTPSPSVENLEEEAKDITENCPLTHMFSCAGLDSQGRTVSQKPSMISRDPKEQEAAMKAEMQQVAKNRQQQIFFGCIEPARRVICMEHGFLLSDFYPFVFSNPLVQRGREEIIAQGLYFGMRGNGLIATHLLIPQVENMLRHILVQHGVITSKLDANGVQDELSLNRIFEDHKEMLESILGRDIVFDLEGLLISRFGSNLRNRVSHGLIPINGFHSPIAFYLWWLVLKLIMIPIIAVMHREMNNEDRKKTTVG